MSWLLRAACRGLDPALFHPERGQSAEPAKAVCRTCPVRVECLEVALAANERLGVWGGTSERERRRMRRPAARECAWWRCRRTFVPPRGSAQRYCSPACAAERRRALGRRVPRDRARDVS